MSPSSRSARIYQPVRNAMQSGKRGSTLSWRLDFDPAPKSKSIDPLMGWSSSNDTLQQLRLTFASKEEAIAYATRNHLSYRVIEPQRPALLTRAYADNFKK